MFSDDDYLKIKTASREDDILKLAQRVLTNKPNNNSSNEKGDLSRKGQHVVYDLAWNILKGQLENSQVKLWEKFGLGEVKHTISDYVKQEGTGVIQIGDNVRLPTENKKKKRKKKARKKKKKSYAKQIVKNRLKLRREIRKSSKSRKAEVLDNAHFTKHIDEPLAQDIELNKKEEEEGGEDGGIKLKYGAIDGRSDDQGPTSIIFGGGDSKRPHTSSSTRRKSDSIVASVQGNRPQTASTRLERKRLSNNIKGNSTSNSPVFLLCRSISRDSSPTLGTEAVSYIARSWRRKPGRPRSAQHYKHPGVKKNTLSPDIGLFCSGTAAVGNKSFVNDQPRRPHTAAAALRVPERPSAPPKNRPRRPQTAKPRNTRKIIASKVQFDLPISTLKKDSHRAWQPSKPTIRRRLEQASYKSVRADMFASMNMKKKAALLNRMNMMV